MSIPISSLRFFSDKSGLILESLSDGDGSDNPQHLGDHRILEEFEPPLQFDQVVDDDEPGLLVAFFKDVRQRVGLFVSVLCCRSSAGRRERLSPRDRDRPRNGSALRLLPPWPFVFFCKEGSPKTSRGCSPGY